MSRKSFLFLFLLIFLIGTSNYSNAYINAFNSTNLNNLTKLINAFSKLVKALGVLGATLEAFKENSFFKRSWSFVKSRYIAFKHWLDKPGYNNGYIYDENLFKNLKDNIDELKVIKKYLEGVLRESDFNSTSEPEEFLKIEQIKEAAKILLQEIEETMDAYYLIEEKFALDSENDDDFEIVKTS